MSSRRTFLLGAAALVAPIAGAMLSLGVARPAAASAPQGAQGCNCPCCCCCCEECTGEACPCCDCCPQGCPQGTDCGAACGE